MMPVSEEVKKEFEERTKQEIPAGWYTRNPESLKESTIPEIIIGATDVWYIGYVTPPGKERMMLATSRGVPSVLPPKDFLNNYISLPDPINYTTRLEDSLTEAVRTFRALRCVRIRSGPSPF